jgi:hypothetical protein
MPSLRSKVAGPTRPNDLPLSPEGQECVKASPACSQAKLECVFCW